MGLNWPELVRQRNEWVAHNFPNTGQPDESIMGCIEEVGELAHAHLKEIQNIRGSADEHVAAGKDAIGDLMVYLMGVMNHTHSFPEPYNPIGRANVHNPDHALFLCARSVGSLCRVQVYEWNTMDIAIRKITHYATRYCELRGWDFDDIVQTTWDAVRQRDWVKHPDTGLPPGSGAPPIPASARWDEGDLE